MWRQPGDAAIRAVSIHGSATATVLTGGCNRCDDGNDLAGDGCSLAFQYSELMHWPVRVDEESESKRSESDNIWPSADN